MPLRGEARDDTGRHQNKQMIRVGDKVQEPRRAAAAWACADVAPAITTARSEKKSEFVYLGLPE